MERRHLFKRSVADNSVLPTNLAWKSPSLGTSTAESVLNLLKGQC